MLPCSCFVGLSLDWGLIIKRGGGGGGGGGVTILNCSTCLPQGLPDWCKGYCKGLHSLNLTWNIMEPLVLFASTALFVGYLRWASISRV